MNEKEIVRISKFLSLVLRHNPETIGIRLDEQGWVAVDNLLQQLKANGMAIDRTMLQEVVDTNSKKRFAISDDGFRIRASQGHSVAIDLGYQEAVPPTILYHGTAAKNLPAIKEKGLLKQKRHHVHLSADEATAYQIGQRHGKPVVFSVLAGQMHQNGHVFFLSANGVWLTDHVPVNYLRLE